jgi:calcineurin-like phosphoesterase family protein
MNYWLISDTHFAHKKMDEWGGRTGDWQEQLWKGLESIPETDTLIHLGDICIGDDAQVLERINNLHVRTKILVRGNHDNKSATWYLEHGFDFVCDGFWLDYMGGNLLLSHRPMHPDMWRFSHNIHGHTHGNNHRSEEYFGWLDPKNYHIDISPELVGYKPLKLDTIMKMRAQQKL